MITLCMDTSHQFLVLAILEDDKVLASVSEICLKKQSEFIFPRLISLFDKVHLTPEDVNQVVITKGPGSYTGIRIAMTIAKVFCSRKEIPLYTLSSLQLIAGKMANCRVLLDARSGRAYTGLYHHGILEGDIQVSTLEEIQVLLKENEILLGDGHLLGREDYYPDMPSSFLALKDQWEKVEHIHTLTPEYLKKSEDYMVK